MTLVGQGSPYVGLRPFRRQDSALFFGRIEQATELLESLYRHRFLGVVGSSGCGKSSLIQAGLIPSLLGGFLLEGRERWRIARLEPGDAPVRSLSRALDEIVPGVGRAPEALQEEIEERRTDAVLACLDDGLENDENVLLLIDQFEEIFAFRGRGSEDDTGALSATDRRERNRRRAEAADFVDILLGLGRQARVPVYVVLTMRSDFLGDCDVFYGLPEAMNAGRYLVPRLGRLQLREVIEGPARLFGAKVDPRLADHLLNELGDRSDRLPILQHVLMRTWEFWSREGKGSVDFSHYKATGGLGTALSRHADEAIATLAREATESLFTSLTSVDPQGRWIRRPRRLSELVDETGVSAFEIGRIVEVLGRQGRNFLFETDPAFGDPRLNLAHESLIRNWPTLGAWVERERRNWERYSELMRRASAWKRGDGALLHGADAAASLAWWDHAAPTDRWAARYTASGEAGPPAGTAVQQFGTVLPSARHQRRRVKPASTLCARWATRGIRDGDDYLLASRYLTVSKLWRSAKRWSMGAAVAAVVILALVWSNQRDRTAALERKELNRMRLDVAHRQLQRDPTQAGLVLLLIEEPEEVAGAAQIMLDALALPPAQAGTEHKAPVVSAVFSADGQRVLTASEDRTARVWNADGSGDPVVLRGHEGTVRSPVFSPDGRRVLTASDDATARVWNADGSDEPVVLRGHQSWVGSAVFSLDGRRVLTASNDATARVWYIDGSEETVVLEGHQKWIRSAVFSPDGRHVLTASDDATARVWNADGSGEPVVLQGHGGAVRSAVFSPDGRRVLTASDDNTARVWSVDGSGEPVILQGHRSRVRSAVFSPDGRRILTASDDNTARVWNADLSGRPVVLGGHEGWVESAVFSPDGRRILTASRDKTARIWNADGSGEPVVLLGHQSGVRSAVFSPDGRRVLTASNDMTARVWNVDASDESLVLRGHQDSVSSAAFSPGGRRVVTASDDNTARIWSADGSGKLVLRGHEDWVRSAVFSPDGRRVLTASEDNTARVWSTDGYGEQVVLRGHQDWVGSALFSPDGQQILTASRDNTARIWNADGSGEAVVLEGHQEWIRSAVFSPDGRHVLTASDDATARVWSVDGSGEPVVLQGHEGAVWSAVFSPDGRRVLTASDDDTARVWSVDGSGEPVILRGHQGRVRSAVFSLDGRRILTASDDNTARVWNADLSGRPVVLGGHEGWVRSAVFSPDGRRVLTASDDDTVRVWSADGSSEPLILRGHQDAVSSAVFSPDGQSVLTASNDHTARVWDLDQDRLRHKLLSRTSLCLDPGFLERSLGESAPGEARRLYEECERLHGRTPPPT